MIRLKYPDGYSLDLGPPEVIGCLFEKGTTMKFTTIFGEKIDVKCAGCVVLDASKFKEGRIYQSRLWDLSQDFETPYPGMVVISPMRHVSNYMDLSKEELDELHKLTIETKKAIMEIFGCRKMAYMFYEKPDGHVHFVIIPLHGLVQVDDKYSVLGELIKKTPELLENEDNMYRVKDAIAKLRAHFKKIG